jgi:hypothetical protein
MDYTPRLVVIILTERLAEWPSESIKDKGVDVDVDDTRCMRIKTGMLSSLLGTAFENRKEGVNENR